VVFDCLEIFFMPLGFSFAPAQKQNENECGGGKQIPEVLRDPTYVSRAFFIKGYSFLSGNWGSIHGVDSYYA
jgi:hypothetical protein